MLSSYLTKNTDQRNHWLTDLISLSVVLLVFYTLWLGSYALFTPDEGRYSEVAREMVASGDYITPRLNGVAFLDKPPLYYWLQAFAIHIAGIQEGVLRFFPALLGMIGCLATYVSGRLLFNRRTAWLSAMILATSPLYFGGAHYANLDLEVAVFISCSLLAFLCALQTHKPLSGYLLFNAYLFASLAALTKGLIGVAFPMLIIGSWIILLWRWDMVKKMRPILGMLFFFLLTVPWYAKVQQANPEFLHFFFVTQQVTRFLSAADFNSKTPGWFYFPIVALGFFPWTAFFIAAISKHIKALWQSRQNHATELFLLLWVIIIFTFFSIPRSKTIGYILPILPPLALLTGSYLSACWEHAKQKGVYLSTLLAAVICSISAYLLFQAPHHAWIDIPAGLTPYLILSALIFAMAAVLLVYSLKKETLFFVFSAMTLCNVLFLLTLISSAPYLNQNSIKPLALSLKKSLGPDTEVITFYKYYHDLPLYLEKRITIVADWDAEDIVENDNWVRELWYGMPFQDTRAWLIKENTFWQRWNSRRRVFTVLSDNYFDEFKAKAKKFYIVQRYKDFLWVSNRPMTS